MGTEQLLKELETTLVTLKAVDPVSLAAERRLSRELQGLFDKGIRKVMAEIARRGVPVDEITRAMILEQVMPDVTEVSERILDAGESLATTSSRGVGAAVGVRITEASPAVMNKLRQHIFTATEDTMKRVRGDVMGALEHAYREGMGIDDAAGYMRDHFDSLVDFRLRLIARTEIQGAQNFAAHETMRDLGVEYEQWWTAGDEDVRGTRPEDLADHVVLHGQITRLGDTFSNGLLYPGDRAGPIEEWVNCRCRPLPFIMPEGKIAPLGQQWFYERDLVTVT